jgi:small subunit ribosomal protein S18
MNMAEEMTSTPEQPENESAPEAAATARGEATAEAARRPAVPGARRFARRKVCAFCADGVDWVDYKDAKRLRKFITERGKILPRRISGACAAHQRMLTTAIKRARIIALLPFKAD